MISIKDIVDNTTEKGLTCLAFVVVEVYGVKTYDNGGSSASFLCADRHNTLFTLVTAGEDARSLGK